MLDFLKSFILGIIEGITEWLPVSSTGHLIIAREFLQFDNVTDSFYSMYSVVIQLGAIMAIALTFIKRLFPLEKTQSGIIIKKDILSIWGKIFIGCVPAGIIGILFDEVIDMYFYSYKTVAFTLIIYGILFIIIENKKKTCSPAFTDVSQIDQKTSLLIGGFQVLSLIPGTSRSGATILGGMLLGADRTSAAEFTFFMAIPIMAGASAIKLLDFGFNFTMNELVILIIGFVTAFLVSVITVKWLLKFVKKHTFKAFGIYRILLGVIVLLYFSFK